MDEHDLDSDCATDLLGECGLATCECGSSVNAPGVYLPTNLLQYTKRDSVGGWFVGNVIVKGGIEDTRDILIK